MTTLGRCPSCGTSLPRARLLVEYETRDGRSVLAECPVCERVDHPE